MNYPETIFGIIFATSALCFIIIVFLLAIKSYKEQPAFLKGKGKDDLTQEYYEREVKKYKKHMMETTINIRKAIWILAAITFASAILSLIFSYSK